MRWEARIVIRRRPLLRGAACTVAAVLTAGGCAVPRRLPDPPPPPPPGAMSSEVLHLVTLGWHVEVALPAHALQGTPLGAAMAPLFPQARHLMFGFGLRRYFAHPDPGLPELLSGLVPGPGAIRVIGLHRPPPELFGAESVVALPVTEAGLADLARFLWDELDRDAHGRPRRVATDPGVRGAFFEATARYDLAYTSNTWAVLALRQAGLPVDPAGVVLAGQAVARARAAAARAA
jgi:hypothetical protein